ncbi:MAG: hypothetical protein ACOC12_11360 [Bacteroidota bacterium]
MKNDLPFTTSQLDDDAYFLFYVNDTEDELNQKLGLGNREYVFVF